ncbi:hypothetical protein G210_3622 [Candida maltosa Xu316]|uniref:Uncharacterized protein n=1 Tax=Candida maltosa (strain Xu316) TaxID=1245528 RepID=M3JUU6_CANMX|nr:hypothetical protein G210_3622 [Candida maltosa Xu316]
MNILDLPTEILWLIINQIPNSQLRKLIDIPELHQLIRTKVYSSIIIGGKPSIEDNDIPWFSGPDEFIQFYTDLNGSWIPKIIKFMDPLDIFQIMEISPSLLSNIHIEISFEMYSNQLDSTKSLFEKLSNLPISITKLEHVGYINHVPINLPSSVTSLTLPPGIRYDHLSFTQDSMAYLTELEIPMALQDNEMGILPSSLRKLKCSLHFKSDTHIQPLNIPSSLECLAVNYVSGCLNVIDLSGLKRLKKLVVGFCRVRDDWLFPSCLEHVENIDGGMTIEKVVDQCPFLKMLIMKGDRYYYGSDFCGCLPSCLLDLDIPVNDLGYVHSSQRVGYVHTGQRVGYMRIPDGLLRLSTHGRTHEQDELILDFIVNPLPRLSHLTLSRISTVVMIGEIPRSLRDVKLIDVQNIDFEKISQLVNLETLEIVGSLDTTEFKYHCPDTLHSLKLHSCKFTKIQINGHNLKRLILSDNIIPRITPYSLITPTSIEDLNLSQNNIFEISPDYKWPNKLMKLTLDKNKLTQIHNLPSSLRTLSCQNNKLGKDIILPESIETVLLGNNFLDMMSISMMNLGDCTHLKRLSLNNNKFTNWNSDGLLSLEYLDLSRNNIEDIKPDSFSKMKEVDLSHNNLRNIDKVSFGPMIRQVSLLSNKLSQTQIEHFIDGLLASGNNYWHLVTDSDTVPDKYKHLIDEFRILIH